MGEDFKIKAIGNNATKSQINKTMGNKKTTKSFTSVDVWRPAFGQVSVKAINVIHKQLSQLSDEECKNTSLRDKVDFLRKAENPDYVIPKKL